MKKAFRWLRPLWRFTKSDGNKQHKTYGVKYTVAAKQGHEDHSEFKAHYRSFSKEPRKLGHIDVRLFRVFSSLNVYSFNG